MNRPLLTGVQTPADIKKMTYQELRLLSEEIRKTIIEVVGSNGGHLSSNLGVVELTIAMHRVFDCPRDSFVWDVGHQCYTHKLLTGRYDRFHTIRKQDGLSGFPKKDESPYDVFDTGHSSTSISAAYGLLAARRLAGEPGKVVAVIGDGALTGGMALEALSHAGEDKKDLVVILNDNKMSISPNTGALSQYLSRLTMGVSYQRFRYRVDRAVRYVPLIGPFLTKTIHRLKRGLKGLIFKDNLFVDLGFEYVGPLNGHNIEELEKVLHDVRRLNRPVVVHVLTRKGKGYSLAENDPSTFHGIGPFCISDGKVEKFDTLSFTEAFSNALVAEAANRSEIVAITAAMSKGTGLVPFQHRFPERFFDTGITEQHAVTFAGGLAAGGRKPVVAIYSTFMQRAVDQVIHDVSLQKLPVIFALDRAGAVPDDGETHQGLYDLALFRPVPALSILTPASAVEMKLMLEWALKQENAVMLRYPKGSCPTEVPSFADPIETGKGVFVSREGSDVIIACTGGMYGETHEAANLLARSAAPVDLLNLRFAKPVDEEWLLAALSAYRAVVFVEDGIRTGGLAEYLVSIIREKLPRLSASAMAFDELYYPQGTRNQILASAGLSPAHIADEVRRIRERLGVDNPV